MPMPEGLIMIRFLLPFLLVAALLGGCQTLPEQRVNERVLDHPELVTGGGRVLLLPIDVEIKEMSASGLSEVVPAWTDTARGLLRQQPLARGATLLRARELQPLPTDLDPELAHQVEEHNKLAKLVWADAFLMSRLGGPAWAHKARHFDYSLGPGLAPLAEHTGADRALLVLGEDVHTTAGRKALMIGLAALGVAVPLGHTFVSVALVDLHSGDLLWMNTYLRGDDTSLLEAEDVRKVLDTLFAGYPGIEAYRQFARSE